MWLVVDKPKACPDLHLLALPEERMTLHATPLPLAVLACTLAFKPQAATTGKDQLSPFFFPASSTWRTKDDEHHDTTVCS